MAQSFQKEKPPARVNLFVEVDTDGAEQKTELSHRALVLGDYTGREDDTPLEEQAPIPVDKNNFESVLKDLDVRAQFDVENKLNREGGDLPVELRFDSMKSFTPEEVAKQVPAVKRLLAMRFLLQDLRNRVVSTRDFRKELERVVKDEGALRELADRLDAIVPPDAPADSAPPSDDA